MMSTGEYSHEPMTASPSSPGHQSPYLPGYLLGESMPHGITSTPRLWSGASPAARSFSTPLTPGHCLHGGSPRTDLLKPKDKLGAPPVKSLFSGTSENRYSSVGFQTVSRDILSSSSRNVTPGQPVIGVSSGGVNISQREDSFYSQSSKILSSPAQLDPFYSQGENLHVDDILDETWVTIFGFPPGAASYILQQFAQYGNILHHKVYIESNWMHIHYQSKIQAKKALSKNGKIFGEHVMIGVTPCIDKSVMETFENLPNMTPSVPTADIKPPVKYTTPIRPLAAAYQAARTEFEVSQAVHTPQKDSSVIAKMKEYLFGW